MKEASYCWQVKHSRSSLKIQVERLHKYFVTTLCGWKCWLLLKWSLERGWNPSCQAWQEPRHCDAGGHHHGFPRKGSKDSNLVFDTTFDTSTRPASSLFWNYSCIIFKERPATFHNLRSVWNIQQVIINAKSKFCLKIILAAISLLCVKYKLYIYISIQCGTYLWNELTMILEWRNPLR